MVARGTYFCTKIFFEKTNTQPIIEFVPNSNDRNKKIFLSSIELGSVHHPPDTFFNSLIWPPQIAYNFFYKKKILVPIPLLSSVGPIKITLKMKVLSLKSKANNF